MTVKRSVSIRGHQTSISVEDAFWSQFQVIAERDGSTAAALIAAIDAGREPGTNLSSAIRLFVLRDLLRRLGESGSGQAPER